MTRNEFRDLDLNGGERTGSCCYSLIIYSKGITGSTNYNLYRDSNNIASTIQLRMWHHIRESAKKTLQTLCMVVEPSVYKYLLTLYKCVSRVRSKQSDSCIYAYTRNNIKIRSICKFSGNSSIVLEHTPFNPVSLRLSI